MTETVLVIGGTEEQETLSQRTGSRAPTTTLLQQWCQQRRI